MELQLGLSLSAAAVPPFDLNGAASVESSSSCLDPLQQKNSKASNNNYYNNKRAFDQAFDGGYGEYDVVDGSSSPETMMTLPLFVWSGRRRLRNDDNDVDAEGGRKETSLSPHRHDDFLRSNISYGYRDQEDDEQLIMGWPRIMLWRNAIYCGLTEETISTKYDDNFNYGTGLIASSINCSSSNRGGSRLVKVKMEGVGIVRKIDLNLYHSYSHLIPSLLLLFATHCQNNIIEEAGSYRVMYQDKAGDWLIAGDVPWLNFIRSVQRIEILISRSG